MQKEAHKASGEEQQWWLSEKICLFHTGMSLRQEVRRSRLALLLPPPSSSSVCWKKNLSWIETARPISAYCCSEGKGKHLPKSWGNAFLPFFQKCFFSSCTSFRGLLTWFVFKRAGRHKPVYIHKIYLIFPLIRFCWWPWVHADFFCLIFSSINPPFIAWICRHVSETCGDGGLQTWGTG